jgi:hypothetical protein
MTRIPRFRRVVLAACAALLALAPAARAQVPQISGDDESRAAQIGREILARGQYVVIDRDTTLAGDFRTPGDLVVYDAEVRLEGNVDGSVLVLGGDFWIRPGGRVGGSIAVLTGGVYPSGLAIVQHDSIFHGDPRGRIELETRPTGRDGEYVAVAEITPAPRPAFFAPAVGPFPTYDRVNGLTLSASANIYPTRRSEGPVINLWGSYRFEQENRLGGGIRWRVPLNVQNLQITGEASRATRTNDAWIRGDVANSVRALALGRDYRDYWDADVLRVMVDRPVGKPLIAGETWLAPRGGIQLSRDRSLPTQRPWALLNREGLERINPPVLEGNIVSLLAGTRFRWVGTSTTFDGDLNLEHALSAPGDSTFTQALFTGTYSTRALRTHLLQVYARAMTPIGGRDAPPQRYGILGGGGTFSTEPIAAFRGDHLVFIESSYVIPVNNVELPFVGIPSLEAVHNVGAAWVGNDEPEWVQNVGAGVIFALVRARVLINPADRPLEPRFSFGFYIPQQ